VSYCPNNLHRRLELNIRKQYHKEYYQKNKEKINKKNKKYAKDYCQWFNNYKKTLKCENCPENRWWVLDFHHRDSDKKKYIISDMITNHMNKNKVLKEIKKCIVLCANCHRDLHYKLNNK